MPPAQGFLLQRKNSFEGKAQCAARQGDGQDILMAPCDENVLSQVFQIDEEKTADNELVYRIKDKEGDKGVCVDVSFFNAIKTYRCKTERAGGIVPEKTRNQQFFILKAAESQNDAPEFTIRQSKNSCLQLGANVNDRGDPLAHGVLRTEACKGIDEQRFALVPVRGTSTQ